MLDWRKPLRLVALPVLLLSGLTACQTTGTAVTDTSCTAFNPISWSSQDTKLTQVQLVEHNAKWKALCERNNGG